ncbi:MAG: sialidase family protein [Verrucomicrobia bacterium]|nr:sialidase family protein [Verrucomicrobiota bacterium]
MNLRILCTTLLLAPLAGSLSAQTKAPAKPDPNFIASPAELKARIPKQLRITKPDYVVFVPEVTDAGVNDTGNEHFLVFDGPDGSIMAVWTQSSAEAQPDQHIAFVRSTDEGVTWSKPRIIAGPKKPGDGHIASWAYPLVSKSGRIYVLYSQHIGRHDAFVHCTGWLHGIHSDDNGATWSKPQNIPVARSINDNPDPTMPPNMLCWQKPLRLGKDGKYFAGFTRWTSFDVRKNPTKSWISADTRVEFMRFENVDDNPDVKDLKISWFAANEKALAVPFPGHPEVSACQEPTVVKLPDGRLFCVMRTASGSPFWSVSSDVGETWTQPRRLLRKDGGEPLLHPLSPCPMYDVGGNEAGSGRYALFIHNHDGHYKNYGPTDSNFHRRPIHLVPGRFQPGADQPVWFDEPKFFMDHDGVSLGKPGTNGRLDLALYSSFTVRKGKPVLWYPERKFFLLGRIIGKEWFVPTADPATDWKRSKPDVTVYLPKEGEHHDGDNEMFIVFKAPKSDELLGMWTQSSVEGRGDNRIMLARSSDGRRWSQPQRIIGTTPGTKEPQASWGVPIVARTGRIYCVYLKEQPRAEAGQKQESGGMGCLTSDDNGTTWTPGADIPMPRNRFDHPDPAIPKSYWLWTTTTRDRHGRHLLGYTTTTSQAVKKWPSKFWVHKDSRCAFARFENIDAGPDPKDLKVTWLPTDREGLEVPNRVFPDMSVAQEPCVVLLPDGRLLVATRTMAGAIWYSVSDDDGATWRKPEPLRYQDGGKPIAQPLAPAPIYPLADGRFLLVFHNNDGTHGGYSQWKTKWNGNQANYIRNPAFIAVGEFRPKAHQPIWFSAPKQILDTQGVIVGPKKTAEIATYPSLTEWHGQRVLWYPDRKYYLLGKYLPDALLAGMKAPTATE